METSKNWAEFENKLKEMIQQENKEQELIDFDKILSGILKVPKPDKN